MAKYRNARLEAELAEEEAELEAKGQEEKVQEQPAANANEEMWKQRYGDLRRFQQERDAQHKAELEELRQTMESLKVNSKTPPKTREEIEAWKNAYPEFAQINAAIIAEEVEKRLKATERKYQDLELTQEEIKREKAFMKLKKYHPDCESIFQDVKFHEWLKEQPEKHQNFIYKSFDADDASLVLDKWKLHTGKSNPEKDVDYKDAGKTVKTKTQANPSPNGGDDYLFTESQIAAADSKWWDANEEKVKDAQRRGKVLMDISGGAR